MRTHGPGNDGLRSHAPFRPRRFQAGDDGVLVRALWFRNMMLLGICLPFTAVLRGLRLLDRLSQLLLLGALRLFSAACMLVVIAMLVYGLVRTLFHPWFS
jgi:hypothetical protein